MSSSMTTMNEEEKEIKIISFLNSFQADYRFDPTEEELIDAYFKEKLEKAPLPIHRIKNVDIYNQNPGDLTENLTSYGGNEFYFIIPKKRNYAVAGSLPKSAAGDGHQKASGNNVRPIYDSNGVEIGSRVLYKAIKASTGQRIPWGMHEYKAKAAQGTTSGTTDVSAAVTTAARSSTGGNTQLDEWVICKFYKKTEDEPTSTPAATSAAAEAAATSSSSAATSAAAENHMNIMEAENTTRYRFPGSDIHFELDTFTFGRGDKPLGKIFKRAEEDPTATPEPAPAAPVYYREEPPQKKKKRRVNK